MEYHSVMKKRDVRLPKEEEEHQMYIAKGKKPVEEALIPTRMGKV